MFRLFDLFWSILGLALLSPLLILVGLAIRISDGGPVFYRQERIGQGGRPFRILKFRTMRVGADRQGDLLTVAVDDRITPLGKWLRDFKIDELPQLVNVLLGQMSLVGPRPEVPKFVALYTPAQRRVLDIRPGITDAASIVYRHENQIFRGGEEPGRFYAENILPNKIRINLEYAAKATLWGNVRIILATLGLVRPPIESRKPGDRRAFDRGPRPAVPVAVEGGPSARLVNLGPGGLLLEAEGTQPVGSKIQVTLPAPGPGGGPVTLEGTIVRSDDQGTAVRFPEPLPSLPYPEEKA
ncbi:sugar transferase [Mesoterricola silvestris]|uniref:Sugar transferase n=1 Tax=Mesoterricola silvestris TaxID=2927979 RepID=A0AA48GU23_9BACT|nr:sugar transferase [Mesoterricola silvestris]BDU71776.1 hypothetical protein METEAL_09500 [Mesoterricola silvestris]